MRVFTIHDSASSAFMRPFFSQAPGAAIREFSDLVNGEKHPVSSHPEDYTLYEIGKFDESTGKLTACEPISLGNGVTFLVQPEQLSLGNGSSA